MRTGAVTSAILATVAIFVIPGQALAEKCSGRWGGQVSTTVTFQDGNKLRYCYQNDCYDSEWLGDKSKRLVFRVGNDGATVEMEARAKGYFATWRFGNQKATATLTCK